MADTHHPIRPPRLTRSSNKESSSGLLMSVIRTLTASKDADERDREKDNLEKEYNESDLQLDKLVLEHHQDLTLVMQAFSKLSTRLNCCKEKLFDVRKKLTLSQQLLHCKRDELKKLWLESVENRYILDLLNKVDETTKVSNSIASFMLKKHYLHATKLLVNSLNSLQKELDNIDALKEIKVDLLSKKDALYDTLMDELHQHIYVKSTISILTRYRKYGIEKPMNNIDGTPSRKISVADILSPSSCVYQNALAKKKNSGSALSVDNLNEQTIVEDTNLSDPEEDSRNFMIILIECLALLNKMSDAVEAIKNRADRELVNIVKRTIKQLLLTQRESQTNLAHMNKVNQLPDQIRISISNSSNNMETNTAISNSSSNNTSNIGNSGQNNRSKMLLDLLELLSQQFNSVVQIHEQIIIPSLRRIENQSHRYGETINIYNMADIWSKLQSVIQLVIDLHVDITGNNEANEINALTNVNNSNSYINNVNTSSSTGNENESINLINERNLLQDAQLSTIPINSNMNVSDLNNFYAKKRTTLNVVNTFGKAKKFSLFRFDLSSHAMSLNAYLQERKNSIDEKSDSAFYSKLNSECLNENEQLINGKQLPENIAVIFNPLLKFINEIDDELSLDDYTKTLD